MYVYCACERENGERERESREREWMRGERGRETDSYN